MEDPGVDGKIILRLISRKWDVKAWTCSRRLRGSDFKIIDT